MTHLPMFDKDCRLFAAVTSFILTLLIGWDALINSDGILYVTQAHLFHSGAWREALAHYPWPGYAALISTVSYLGPSLEHSAILINALCYALMVAGFVTLIKQAGANLAVQWIAALALLIHPALNDYREYIIRDVGLWGMLFWGVYALIRFHAHRQWRDVFLWTASMSIATLFRVEGVVFLALAPLGLLLFTPRRTVFDVIRLQSIFITATLIGIGIVLLSNHAIDLGRLNDLPRYLYGLFHAGDAFMLRAEGLGQVFSHEMKPKHASIALIGAIVTYLTYLALKTFTPVYLFLSGVTQYKHLFPKGLTLRYVCLFITIASLIILTFFSQLYFLSTRYVMPLVLMFMPLVPYGIHHIAVSRGNGTFLGRPFMFPVMTLLLVAMFISGVTSFGYSKEYLREAGHFIETHVKADATLFMNENHVAYYAKRYLDIDAIQKRSVKKMKQAMDNRFKGSDIVVLYHDKKTPELNAFIEKQFSNKQKIVFENKRHDAVTLIILNEQALLPSSPEAHSQSTP